MYIPFTYDTDKDTYDTYYICTIEGIHTYIPFTYDTDKDTYYKYFQNFYVIYHL